MSALPSGDMCVSQTVKETVLRDVLSNRFSPVVAVLPCCGRFANTQGPVVAALPRCGRFANTQGPVVLVQ